jgi:competence protein ComEC
MAGLWFQLFAAPDFIPLWLVAGGIFLWWFVGLAPLCGLLLAAISSLHCHWYLEHLIPQPLVKQDVLLTGQVEGFPRIGEGVRTFVFRVDSGLLSGRYQLRIYEDSPGPVAGETWRLQVRLKRPLSTANRAGFNRESWYLWKRIHGIGYVRKSALNTRLSERSGGASIHQWRAEIRNEIDEIGMDGQARALLQGIVVGARDGIDSATWEVLRSTGTAHLMAISGMHIGLVAMLTWFPGRLLAWLLACARIAVDPLLVARSCSLSAAIGYASLAGGTVPTLRALCMVGVVILFGCYRRQIGVGRLLSFAMLALLAWDPLAVLSAGFWLSFIAVAILATLVTGRDTRALPPKVLFRQALAALGFAAARFCSMQVRLSLGLALPLSLLFGQVSMVAFLANLLAVPVFTFAILPPALFGGALMLTGMPGGEPALLFAGTMLGWLLTPLERIANWPGAVWFSGPMSWSALGLASVGLLLLLSPRPLPGFSLGAILLSLGLLRNEPGAVDGLRVEVLDVGQGLAVLLQTARHRLVYDSGGKWPGGDAGQTVLLPVLRASGIRHLDALLISHADTDHSGGAGSLAAEIDIATVLTSDPSNSAFADAIECRRGLTWVWDSVRFRILHPEDAGTWSENNGSCVLQVEYQGSRVLLPGDIEAAAEGALVAANMIAGADLLVAAHHGSKTSSSDLFVRRSSPSYVVFSVGYANRWLFPSPRVVERWQRSGSCALTTSDAGAIEFVADGDGFRLTHAERGAFRRPWPLRRLDAARCMGTINSPSTAL